MVILASDFERRAEGPYHDTAVTLDAGDDTDGHVDDIARFVDPGTVAAAAASRDDAKSFAPSAENLRRLRGVRDQDGEPPQAP